MTLLTRTNDETTKSKGILISSFVVSIGIFSSEIIPFLQNPIDHLPSANTRLRYPTASNSIEVAADAAPRRYLLLNVGGWLLFSNGMVIASLPTSPLSVLLALTPVHLLIGFVLSLLLGLVLDRLGVGPASFGRALAIIFAGSVIAGVLFTVAFNIYRRRAATHGGRISTSHVAGERKGNRTFFRDI